MKGSKGKYHALSLTLIFFQMNSCKTLFSDRAYESSGKLAKDEERRTFLNLKGAYGGQQRELLKCPPDGWVSGFTMGWDRGQVNGSNFTIECKHDQASTKVLEPVFNQISKDKLSIYSRCGTNEYAVGLQEVEIYCKKSKGISYRTLYDRTEYWLVCQDFSNGVKRIAASEKRPHCFDDADAIFDARRRKVGQPIECSGAGAFVGAKYYSGTSIDRFSLACESEFPTLFDHLLPVLENALKLETTDPLWIKWFGTTPKESQYAKDRLQSVVENISQYRLLWARSQVKSCKNGAVGFVAGTGENTYNIGVCPKFWNRPLSLKSFMNNKISSLFHEMMHSERIDLILREGNYHCSQNFLKVCDLEYSQDGAIQLKDPKKVRNAQNYAFFLNALYARLNG